MRLKNLTSCFLFFVSIFICFNYNAQASNVQISDVRIKNLNPFTRTANIEFRLSQQSPYPESVLGARDSIWIFGKYWLDGADSAATGWHHLGLADEQEGIFIPSHTAGEAGDLFTITWDFSDNDDLFNLLSSGNRPLVRICAIEMVSIPATDNLDSFYLAKYEVSQAQYADYLNMLDTTTARNRRADKKTNGYSVSFASNAEYGAQFAASAPERACNFISFEDAKAYADWAGAAPAYARGMGNCRIRAGRNRRQGKYAYLSVGRYES
ncbi:MAG: SUMF1/EgtB/PvdO family nonheme iron enzyme [Candidatus Omnitrophota bacterium]